MPQLKDRKNLLLNESAFVFFFLTRLFAFCFSFYQISDVELYFIYFQKISAGLTPYSQFSFEYPPLTLFFIYFPAAFLNEVNFSTYYLAFAFVMLLIDCACLMACRFYCRSNLKLDEESISFMTIIYALFGLLLFRLLYHRLDLFVGLIFVLSMIFFEAKNPRLNSKFLLTYICGFFYKLTPIITLPAALIIKGKTAIKNFVFFALICTAIIFSLEIFTQHNFLKNIQIHEQRGVQIESSFSSILLFKNLLTAEPSKIYHASGAWNIKLPQLLEISAKYFGHFILLLFYAALFFQKRRKKVSDEDFLNVTLISILLFFAFQRVLSPQFFIWLLPVAAIWLAKNRSLNFLLIFSFLFFATFFIFSLDYLALVNQEPLLIVTLFLRNLTLIIFSLFLATKFLYKNER